MFGLGWKVMCLSGWTFITLGPRFACVINGSFRFLELVGKFLSNATAGTAAGSKSFEVLIDFQHPEEALGSCSLLSLGKSCILEIIIFSIHRSNWFMFLAFVDSFVDDEWLKPAPDLLNNIQWHKQYLLGGCKDTMVISTQQQCRDSS